MRACCAACCAYRQGCADGSQGCTSLNPFYGWDVRSGEYEAGFREGREDRRTSIRAYVDSRTDLSDRERLSIYTRLIFSRD